MAPLVVSMASLGLCVFFFLIFRWYISRKTAASQLLSEYRAEVYRLISDIDAATDRDSLLVQERIKTLNKLLEDTDRRISVYMRELQRSRNGEAMYASLGRGIRAALDSRPPPAEQGGEAAPAPDIPRPETETANAAAEEPSPAEVPAAGGRRGKKRQNRRLQRDAGITPEAPAKPKLKVQIAELSAQGLTTQEIASRLDLSLAEVDLALNLLRRFP